jgi:hypothetical protein
LGKNTTSLNYKFNRIFVFRNWYGTDKCKNEYPHRFAWIFLNSPIAKKRQINHLCHNRGCVTPYHLYLGTKKENTADSIRIGTHTAKPGAEHFNSKLTWSDIENIREEYGHQNIKQIDLARKYNMSKAGICRIVNEISYKGGGLR